MFQKHTEVLYYILGHCIQFSACGGRNGIVDYVEVDSFELSAILVLS